MTNPYSPPNVTKAQPAKTAGETLYTRNVAAMLSVILYQTPICLLQPTHPSLNSIRTLIALIVVSTILAIWANWPVKRRIVSLGAAIPVLFVVISLAASLYATVAIIVGWLCIFPFVSWI